MFLGANDYSIRKGVEYVGADNIRPGDVILMNYPYWNSAHTYDATLFSAVFDGNGDAPYMYLCVRAHWIDLGAKDADTSRFQSTCTRGYLPGTRIFKEGEPDQEWIELLRFNSRMPDILIGDLNAMVASLRTGERRIRQVLDKFGAPTVDAAVGAFAAHGERIARAAIARLPREVGQRSTGWTMMGLRMIPSKCR